ncbi:MAG TPA: non-ribosomal peptide synthetase [Pyrinomonadaceae bacterium]
MSRIEKLIFDQAARTPNAVAIEFNGTQLSYSDVQREAVEIGRVFTQLGFIPGRPVAICLERSVATIPLLLGIWKAGGVVVPINPNTPEKTLEWLIKDFSPWALITSPALEDRVTNALDSAGLDAALILLDVAIPSNGHRRENLFTLSARPRPYPTGHAGNSLPDDTCYIIYTSGSEGRPKGVMGSHKSLVQYVKWQVKEFSINEADRFSQIAPLSFDFSLKELLVPLVCGARVCMVDTGTVRDPRKFLNWVANSRITVMCCVPTLLRSLLQVTDSTNGSGLRTLRYILISGDMLRWDDVTSWRTRFGNAMSLFNLYGPTESTVIKLFYPIPETMNQESVNVPVGKPIEEAEILILDEEDQPCLNGQVGEIVILSEWIARGYLNAEGIRSRSFCHRSHNGARVRAYKTGDLGRLLSSGDIELVGRKDRQVKIRGYRIELDEIESVLSEHPAIRDVAVILSNKANDGDLDNLPAIVCYFTAGDESLGETELRNYAKARMLPQAFSLTQFTRLQQLPLTANGKVNRLELEALDPANQPNPGPLIDQEPHLASLLPVQQRIATMWRELLAVESVDPGANFFELGGDSMTAIRLLRRLREDLHAQINLEDLYKYQSVSELATRVEQLL